jgi:Tol biopolymer transport system component
MKKTTLFIVLFYAFGVFAQERLTPELLWKLGRVNNPQLSPDAKTLLYEVKKYELSANKGINYIYTLSPVGGTPVQVTDDKSNAFNAKWRPDGKKICYMSSESGDVQLWEINPDGSGKQQITNVTGGISSYKYAPNGMMLAYSADVKLDRMANEMYSDLPEVKARIVEGLFYRHWDAWHDYAYSHIFIAPYLDGKITADATDIMKEERFDAPLQPFGGDEQYSWSPDGKKLAYTCKKLNGTPEALSTNSDIYLYNTDNQQTTNLTENNPGYDQDPCFAPDGKKIAWLSMKRIGYEADKNRLMVYYFGDKKTIDITEKFDYPVDAFSWTPASNAFYRSIPRYQKCVYL